MRKLRSTIAGAAATVLTIGALALGATAATAAYEESRPGAESPSFSASSSWKPSNPATRIAQSFVQPEDGRLASFSVMVYDIDSGSNLASFAIHQFDENGPSAEPIEGGIGQVTGTSAGEEGVDNSLWANVEFLDRPVLEAGVTYAFVANPFGNEDPEEAVSFGSVFAFPQPAGIVPWIEEEGEWFGYANSIYIAFKSELVTLFGETEEPTLVVSDVCDVEATVTLPESEGIVYTQEREGDVVTVTAVAADGYELAPDAVTSWEFNVAAEPCPVDEGDGDENGDDENGENEGDGEEEPPTSTENSTDELATTGAASVAGLALTGATLLGAAALTFALTAVQRKRTQIA